MGKCVYYFYLGRSKSKAKKKIHQKNYLFAIAFDAWNYRRTLESRGWTDSKQVYFRLLTPAEKEISNERMRVIMGRYDSLEKLLEDEKEILGENSQEFLELEKVLSAVAAQNTYYPKLEK